MIPECYTQDNNAEATYIWYRCLLASFRDSLSLLTVMLQFRNACPHFLLLGNLRLVDDHMLQTSRSYSGK